MQLQDAEDVLETCHNSLDDLWKLDDYVYPQSRMVHLMDIVAHNITRFIQTKCSTLDLWHSPYSQVEESLHQVGFTFDLSVIDFLLPEAVLLVLCIHFDFHRFVSHSKRSTGLNTRILSTISFFRESIYVKNGWIFARN